MATRILREITITGRIDVCAPFLGIMRGTNKIPKRIAATSSIS